MSNLSRKILQLMSLEAQLEKLKKEIVEKHQDVITETDQGEVASVQLKRYMSEYEQISGKYNELFAQILDESVKMKEEYISLRKD